MRKFLHRVQKFFLLADSLTMEDRIYHQVTLYAGLLTIFILGPSNFFQEIPVFHNVFIFILGILSIVFYLFAKYLKLMLRGTYLILSVGLMDVLWLTSGGSDGSIQFYFILVAMMSMALLNGRKRNVVLVFQVVNITLLLICENVWPTLIIHHVNQQVAYIDRTTGFIGAVFMMAGFVSSILWNYRHLLGAFRTLSVKDGLTNLYNHKFIHERLAEEISVAIRYKQDFSLILADIDHFKTINDQFGHQAGDQVLRGLPITMRTNVRKHDIIGRYGGEEFLILLPHTDLAGAKIVAEKLRVAIMGARYMDSNYQVTVSMGVATFDGTADCDLVSIADRRLYKAKHNGRNQVVSD